MLASIASILPSGIGFGRGSGSDDRDRERQDREREQRERDKERGQSNNNERASETAEEVTPRAADNDGKLRENMVDEHGGKKRRERVPNETFIVVRPPPSVSNHPLNLQLQLVPPQTKERSASGVSTAPGLSTRPSGEYRTSDEAGETQSLRRVQSVRSNRSDQAASFYASSSASMSSIASTASTASTGSRRMIVPLYNLSAHNVMTNTVLDAGTDAKVAKFHKRGMEILALAVLECVEVWPSYGRSGPGHVAFLNATNGASIGAGGGAGGQHPSDHDGLLVTPTSSAISLSSAGSYPPHAYPYPHPHHSGSPRTQQQKLASPGSSTVPTSASSGPLPTAPVYGNIATPNAPSSPSGAKRIFGKIFKKRESQMQSAGGGPGRVGDASLQRSGSMAIEVRSPSNSDLRPSTAGGGGGPKTINGLTFGSLSKRRSMNVSSPTPSHFSVTPAPAGVGVSGGGGSGKDQPQLQPAILGIHPTLSAPIVPPAGRPTRYVWIVRKWLKGADNGLLGGVMRNMSSTIGGIGNLSSQQQQLQGGGQGQGEVGMEVRFEWVRGQSKRKAVRKSGLGKRGSTSFSQEEQATGAAGGLRARRSLIADRSSDAMQEKSRSRGRGSGRPATASGAAAPFSSSSAPPRASGESETRRSAEHGGASSHDSRTNSMTSAFSDEIHRRGGAIAEERDEGEESDPEDSETPWTCSLVVSSIPTSAARLWEHEYIEQGHAHGFPLAKRESRRSGLSHTAEAGSSEARGSASSPDRPPPVPPKPRPEVPGTLLRLKVGAISPAVHHPKVVAQLKVPYPLPDVEVTRGRVRRRVLTPAGVAVARGETFSSSIERDATTAGDGNGNGNGNGRQRSRGVFGGGSGIFGNNGNANASTGGGEEDEGLVLTAEEIKDVLSCTAFWIVVREGFGGVGKVTRKGDGWRLRG